MTVEPPKGVKANLQRSFGSAGAGAVTERLYEETCPDKPAWKNLLFGLCLFNAVLHERKKYGCLGWNVPYEFNDSDLEVSILQLEMLLAEQEAIPWPALWYLTGEVTYGGRVTDDNDRHTLHCMLQKFYQPKALQPKYSYSDDEIYHPLAVDATYADMKTYIDSLPASDSPELFGMNDNAEKSCLESQANELIDTILNVQPRIFQSLIGSHKSSDEMVLDMAQDMMRRLPEQVEFEEDEQMTARSAQKRPTLVDIVSIASGAYFKTIRKSAHKERGLITEDNRQGIDQIKSLCSSVLFTVLRQEIDRFNTLLLTIHKSLKALCRAVKGEIVMSLTLEEAYNAMLSQRVPKEWMAHAYESCKPLGPWVHDLILRVEFFGEWCELVIKAADKAVRLQNLQPPPGPQKAPSVTDPLVDDGSNSLAYSQPRSYWLSGFFFPQGFLTAVLQNHARKIGVSVDSLHFNFHVQPDSAENQASLNNVKKKLDLKGKGFKGSNGPEDGVYVFGLYLDGAQWDLGDMALSDSLPGNRFCRLPEIHFKPSADMSGSRPATASALESPMAMFKTHKPEDQHSREIFEAPLYRTSKRAGTLSSTGHSTNFITTVSLPSKKSPEFWVMRGVALLCQLDD